MTTKITVKSVRKPNSKKTNAAKKAPKAGAKTTDESANKNKTEKFMFSVDENLSFYLNDGRRLYNLRDLENALQGMNTALFRFHVNEERNDFANWIQDVFGYVELANEVKKVKTQKGILSKIKSNIS